ncbi:ParM/StbA family protein [Paenibacillus sp. Y412MC10]|uniref:ParM/StbA family protein n=1 Tax=Geobacillus sp. (strain Y412MC10) TaxID=481743 RepID=UPI0021B48628|nr:ParM/StbA family protein [Paenibacillus sp. Y412MC10]
MVTEQFELQAGSDPGNTRVKISYMDKSGNICSFSIPTVVAPANAIGDPLRKESKEILNTDRLHVYIQSKSLSSTYFYVGDFARDKDKMAEPSGGYKSSSELHLVAQLTALAVAAAELGEYHVNHSYAGGLPIEEFKEVDIEEFLAGITGEHVVEFLDGVFLGKKVVINITGGQVNIEGATTSLSLTNNIKDGKLVELPKAETFDESEYVIGDLGAGTLDAALFGRDGLNGVNSTNWPIGTNSYIDAMLREINEIPEFQAAREFLKENHMNVTSPYSNREQFLNQVVVPEVEKMLKDKKKNYEPKFLVSWARVRNVDVTKIVLAHMKNYFDEVNRQLNLFSYTKAANVENFYLVGGGVLFAYYYFRKVDFFQLPDDEVIAEAQYFTSRAYLINSFIEKLTEAAMA